MSLRVLHLLAPAPFGGLETVVRHLARAQARAGAEVHIAATVPDDAHPFVEAARADGLDVHVLRVRGRGYRRERQLVARLLADLAPAVLHTHGYRPDILDAPVARAAGIATATTAHGFTGNGMKNRAYEWAQRRSFRKFGAVVAVSSGLVSRLVASGVPRERVHLLPNARLSLADPLPRADARHALGLSHAGPPVVGWVGRVGPEKGPDLMVQAMAGPALAGAQLCMVGEGRALEASEALASQLQLDERVYWAGRMPDAGRFMRAFDVLCLSSRTEGTPMVLFEADQADLTVVSTAVGGVPHVLGDGWNVVPPDDPEALAEALARALNDPDAAADARARARQRIRAEFDPARWAARHLEIYRGLAAERGLAAPAFGGTS